MAGQWRTAPGPKAPLWLGLDYAACETGLRMAGIEATPQLWTELQLIEAGAVAALNAR